MNPVVLEARFKFYYANIFPKKVSVESLQISPGYVSECVQC